MDKNKAYDKLIELGVSEQTLDTVCNINGFTMKTMEDILYAVTGYRDFDQFAEEVGDCNGWKDI